jgi:ring-1,2-phenylacetyl-CoA epoxidase subunit PaaC
LKEARYHQQHAADWTIRLGDGTDESHARMERALDRASGPTPPSCLPPTPSMRPPSAAGLGPSRAALRDDWLHEIDAVLAEATLARPADTPFVSTGTQGVHSEHMGFILAEMQSLQRRYPGGVW